MDGFLDMPHSNVYMGKTNLKKCFDMISIVRYASPVGGSYCVLFPENLGSSDRPRTGPRHYAPPLNLKATQGKAAR